ncbi:MAG TPA: hypothetical protein VM869_10855 [Enhygromyxa sp.]|nr:hypothetical protein [Enhygromyxa sp.]
MLLLLAVSSCGGRGPRDTSPEQSGEPASVGAIEPATAPSEPDAEQAAKLKREQLEQFMARFEREAAAAPPPPGPDQAGDCPGRSDRDRHVGVIISPLHPAKGKPVRILAATLDGEEALALRVEIDGQPIEVETEHRLGVPASTVATFTPSKTGKYEVVVGREGKGLRCVGFGVRERPFKDDSVVDLATVWDNQRSWNSAEEALYSAWVRELFAGPADQDLAWKALSEVTSDADRNLLHNHLGREEDHRTLGMELVPDCADTPYFLRAYWAYKRGLPYGFRKCSRGKGRPPDCFDLRTNLDPPDRRPHWLDPDPSVPPPDPLPEGAAVPTHNEEIEYFFRRTVGWGVHTGNGRTAFGDSNSDLYPVNLDRRGLRPGIVYADPYGHILVLAELVAPRGSQPGILFAIDGQPDGSITRKRFWEGNFLWNQSDPTLGGSGFKAFRPLAMSGDAGQERLTQMSDETLAGLRDYGDVSSMQRELSPTQFYDLMERLITPGVRSPFAAQAELVAALAEAARVRVTSVNNGLEHYRKNPDEPVEMPWGHEVFETAGAWENFSTPARDLRLLIAIDVVLGFADKVRRNPEAFGLDPKADPAHLEQTLEYLDQQRELLLADLAHAITYTRSDGSTWQLSLTEIVARAPAFESAYNPNDCAEIRWGAPEGSDEAKTCNRRAPEDQQIKMRHYRVWFAERRRPARGDEGPEIPELSPATAPQ